jgi:hypothetical protein
MKKIVLVLAVLLLAVPAMADVIITAEDEGDGVVAVRYNAGAEEPNRVRAFALDIFLTAGTIDDINDFHVGESNSPDLGYGIFMGSIEITEEGDVVDYGDPVAPEDSPGSVGILGDPNITVELGSLYNGEANAPDPCGLLFRIIVSEDCNLCITENETRGGIVMEDLSDVTVSLPCNVPVAVGCQCFGDITGTATTPPYDPDGMTVDIFDLSVMALTLAPTAPTYTMPTPAGMECLDLCDTGSTTLTGGDGTLDIFDLSALALYLAPYAPTYSTTCITIP